MTDKQQEVLIEILMLIVGNERDALKADALAEKLAEFRLRFLLGDKVYEEL